LRTRPRTFAVSVVSGPVGLRKKLNRFNLLAYILLAKNLCTVAYSIHSTQLYATNYIGTQLMIRDGIASTFEWLDW